MRLLMNNVTAIFIPTTNYADINDAPTLYTLKIDVEEIGYHNIDDVLGDIKEAILCQLLDVITPPPARPKKKLTMGPSYIVALEKEENDRIAKKVTKNADTKSQASLVPPELLVEIENLCTDSVRHQFKSGNEKVVNALVGMLMKQNMKIAPDVAKQLIIDKLTT